MKEEPMKVPISKPRNPVGKTRKGTIRHKDKRSNPKDEKKYHD